MTILHRRKLRMDNGSKKSKKMGEKSNEMNAMDQGLNLVSQTVNHAIGLDKGNDGKQKKS